MNEYFAQDIISEMNRIVGNRNIKSCGERSCGDLEFDLNQEGMTKYRKYIRKYPKITMLEKSHCDTNGNTLRFTQPSSKGKWYSQIRREEDEQSQIEWENSITVDQLHEEMKQFFEKEPKYDVSKNETTCKEYIEYDLFRAREEERDRMYKYMEENPDSIMAQLFLGLFFCHSERYPRFCKHY